MKKNYLNPIKFIALGFFLIFLLFSCNKGEFSDSKNHITNTHQTNSPDGFGIFKIGNSIPENPFFSKNYYASKDIEKNGDYSNYTIYGYEHPNGYIVDLSILTYKDIIFSITFPKIEDREKVIPDIIQIFNFKLDTFIRYTHETGVKVAGITMHEGCREHVTITGTNNVNQIKTTIDHYEERSIDCDDKSIEFITEYSMADMFHSVGLSITDTLVYTNFLYFLKNQENEEKKNKVF